MTSNEKTINFQDVQFCELFQGVPDREVVGEAVKQKLIRPGNATSLGNYGTCDPCGGSMFIDANSETILPPQCPNKPAISIEEYASRLLTPSLVDFKPSVPHEN